MLIEQDNSDSKLNLFPELPADTLVYSWADYSVPICHIACELYSNAGLVHFYIPDEFKTKSNIEIAKTELLPAVCKELRSKGIDWITTNCDVNDTKTAKLFQDVGFITKDITIGLYNIAEGEK